MFYFLQKVILKSSKDVYIYKGYRDGIYTFSQNGEKVDFLESEVKKDDFQEIWESVLLFGNQPLKRLARGIK